MAFLIFVVLILLPACPASRQAHTDPVNVEPAAHETFLAWARERGYSNLKPVETQQEGLCWSVRDSSPSEYLYGLAACPGEEITTIRVFRQGTVWKAEQAHFQASVGKPSWQEIMEAHLRELAQGLKIRMILKKDDIVVVALVQPENPPDSEGWETYRFTRGDDGLWRSYSPSDALQGGWATPEDALIGFALKNFPTYSILGNCAPTQEVRESNGVCWTLKTETGERRTYTIGPALSTGEEVDFVRRTFDSGAPAWVGFPYDRFPPI